MATETAALPKATKILNIRRPWHTDRSSFFGLPQEIRDVIYELVLVEPPLWEREHKKGCPKISPTGGAETPVLKCTLEEYDREHRGCRGGYSCDDRRILEQCASICQGRSGLSFLRTNRQIYQEARKIFFAGNTFCYPGTEAFMTDMSHAGPAFGNSLRRLSIVYDQPKLVSLFASGGDGERFLTALTQMRSLEDLGLPTHFLSWSLQKYLSKMPNLKMLRASYFNCALEWPLEGKSSPEKTYMRIEMDIELPKCFAEGHPSQLCLYGHCGIELAWHLWYLHDRYRRPFLFLNNRDSVVPQCLSMTKSALLDDHITSSDGSPRVIELELDDGTHEWVTCLGLPRIDKETSEREEAMKRRAIASNARRIRAQPCQDLAAAYAELNLASSGQPRRSRHVSSLKPALKADAEVSKEQQARDRAERLRSIKGAEAAQAKKARKKSCKVMRESVRAQSEDKKAARKRLGRR